MTDEGSVLDDIFSEGQGPQSTVDRGVRLSLAKHL